jgi:hypothetical protein
MAPNFTNKNNGIRSTKYHNNSIATLIVPNCTVCIKRNIADAQESRGVWELNFKAQRIYLCDGCKSHLDHLELEHDKGIVGQWEAFVIQ